MSPNTNSKQKDLGPIIRVVDVGKTFREGTSRTDALRDVTFDIMPGEFCTIIGRSGSGKSTLLNMLAGLDHPTRGQIVILGKHIERMNEDQLVKFRLNHVGFVFQSYNLFPSYDALENVAMPLTYRGVPKALRVRRARKMIQAVGLMHRMHHTPNKMSGGEQQRIGIARALVTNPQIIFADEPTGNLDVKTSARALKLMTDCVRERGTTLIVVTHDPEMSRYADHVIRLLDGKVIENTINQNPEPIKPPEDSGQDWAQEPKKAPEKGDKPEHGHRRLFERHKRDAQAQQSADASPSPEPEKRGDPPEAEPSESAVQPTQAPPGNAPQDTDAQLPRGESAESAPQDGAIASNGTPDTYAPDGHK